ncbi:SDR family oxidoreductase [Alkalicoccus urumqiensis]|uniref:NAD(P)-dependent oxidoreductase n=1 Tax=Alkalicoccus urumqiensis TaxID=1548213 RepID=A0A2P6MIK0_ALKUR|nr:SDR family oxidoreductase [Alkalicoccus urumqiensis]PRO66109.1 NAD(P)-dependent oxidoreductase [Alkalicoccus urumqiensis]
MKVLVIGANGQIGSQLVTKLHDGGEHDVRAMVRKEEQKKAFEDKGVEAVLADLEGSVDEIAEAMKGCDAAVFAAGSGGSTGPDKTLLIDLDGAGKSVEAAEKAGVDRFLMVSAIQAHNRKNWSEKIRHYFAAKHYADRMLMNSSLNYTIVRPGGLENEPGTGKVSAGENLDRANIPREDVASVLAAAISNENTYRKGFDLVSGEHSIEDALNQLS